MLTNEACDNDRDITINNSNILCRMLAMSCIMRKTKECPCLVYRVVAFAAIQTNTIISIIKEHYIIFGTEKKFPT